jgi:hypothetical protein
MIMKDKQSLQTTIKLTKGDIQELSKGDLKKLQTQGKIKSIYKPYN